MKKTESPEARQPESDEMLSEYALDYRKAKPNRFASRVSEDRVTVTLDPDVAEVFKTSKAVNELLRAVIAAVPGSRGKKPASKNS